MKEFHHLVGLQVFIDNFARNWNEEAFLLSANSTLEPISEVIHKTSPQKSYWVGDTRTIYYEFATAQEEEYPYRVFLLVQYREAETDQTLLAWNPIGEYYSGAVGICEAYRKKGAGTAFFKDLFKRGIAFDPYFSPEGFNCAKRAFLQLCQEDPKNFGPPESVQLTTTKHRDSTLV